MDDNFPDRQHEPFPSASSGEAMLVTPRLETIIEDSDPFDDLWAAQEANLVKAEVRLERLAPLLSAVFEAVRVVFGETDFRH